MHFQECQKVKGSNIDNSVQFKVVKLKFIIINFEIAQTRMSPPCRRGLVLYVVTYTQPHPNIGHLTHDWYGMTLQKLPKKLTHLQTWLRASKDAPTFYI